MEEILIGDKKYVSSKRAAKMTGYAKDYIGQLCREGRVPARLVGRSWYVLESAIQDHRFGDEKIEKAAKTPKMSSHETWEEPRYEAAATEEVLPPVNRLEVAEEAVVEVAQNLQDTWKAWFDRVAEAEPITPKRQEVAVEETTAAVSTREEEVNVPVRAIYNQLPIELRPRHHAAVTQEEEPEEEVIEEVRISRSNFVLPLQMAGALLAVIFALLAVFGSGYFDTYFTSHSQAGMFAGVYLYNR